MEHKSLFGSHMTRRCFSLGATTAAAGALCGCISTNPATGRTSFTGFYSLEDDIRMGREEHPKILKEFGGEYDDRKLQSYVDHIGKKAATRTEYPQLPYKFTILNSKIVNAFALPGGYVYVTRGLLSLASSEAEVAGVISHELGHVNARHTAERMSTAMIAQLGVGLLGIATKNEQLAQIASQGAAAYIQSYSRQQEFEADTLGVRYMSRVGYDPEAMVTFLDTLRDHSILEAEMNGLPPGTVDEYNIMATHPRTKDRVEKSMKEAAAEVVRNPVEGRDDHLNAIDGMMYGDDPKEGIIQGRRFVHPKMKFEFTVPDEFVLHNGASRIVANDPKGALVVFDMGKVRTGVTMQAFIRDVWAKDIPLNNLEAIDINGMKAATAHFQVDQGKGPMDYRLVAARGNGETVYRFLFLSPAARTGALSEGFRYTTYSLRRLSDEDAADIKPYRLIVVPIVEGDTIAALSRNMPEGKKFEAEAFRVLNDLKPGDPLPAKGRVKVVVS